MANFDFSSFLRSIATPAVSAPPVPPQPEEGGEEGEATQGEGSENSTTLAEQAPEASAQDRIPTAQKPPTNPEQDTTNQPHHSREWLMGGAGEATRGGIATRLPIERHVKLDAPAWRDANNPAAVAAEIPQLAVRPVTTLKDPLGDKRIPLTQVAVNRRFLCYALKKGDIRAMDRIAGVRSLIRQHSSAVSDMKFLSYDDDWLLTAGLDHKIVIQELKSDDPGIRHKILLQIQLQVPLPTPSEAPVRAIWAPRHEKFIIFAVQSFVYLCSVERAFRSRHIRDATGYLSDLEWDSGAVVALKVGENNAAFGQLSSESAEELTVLNGNDEEGLITAGSRDGQIRLWNLEEHDLFGFLDQEEPILPFLTFAPSGSHPVQYVGWCPTSGSSCLLTVSGDSPFQCLKLWKYELGSPTASSQSLSPPIELQCLEVGDSADSGEKEDGYGTVLVAKDADLLLLADVREPNMIILHTLEDEPGRLMFESYARFRVKQPILSMVMGGDAAGRGGDGYQFDVYSVQSEAVQQYTVDPQMCLPSCQGSESTDTSSASVCGEQQVPQLQAEVGTCHGNENAEVEPEASHWQDACPSGDELRSVSASLPSLFGGRFAESSSNNEESQVANPSGNNAVAHPANTQLPCSATTGQEPSVSGDLQMLGSSTSHRQESAAELPEKDSSLREQRPEAAVAAINMIRMSQSLGGPASQDGPINEATGVEDMGIALHQQQALTSQPLVDLRPVFQQVEADQKRNIQVLEHKLGRAFHSLNKKLDSGFEDRRVRAQDNADSFVKMESQFQEFAGRAINAITTAVQKMVQEEVRASIRVNVNAALQKAVGDALSRQVSAGLQRSVEAVVLAQLPKTVNRALQDNFQESFHASIIPAFESAVQNMFGQIQSVFSQGLSEHVNSAKDLNGMVEDNVCTMTTLSEGVRGDLDEVKSQIQELKQQVMDVQRCLLAVRDISPTPLANNSLVPSPDMLIQEVGVLLKKEEYDEAFHKALSLSQVEVTNWLIAKVDHNNLFAGTSPCPLRQEVLLSLLNQLGCDMMENTAVKLEWIKGVSAHLDPLPLTSRQLQLMHGVLDHLITVIQTMIASQKLTGQMMVSAKMALNMLMGVRKQ